MHTDSLIRSIIVALVYAVLGLEYAQTSVTALRPPRHPASTKPTCCARCSVLSSKHAIVDICCLRQQQFQLHYDYFHSLTLRQKLDPRLTTVYYQRTIMHSLFKSMQVNINFFRMYAYLRKKYDVKIIVVVCLTIIMI